MLTSYSVTFKTDEHLVAKWAKRHPQTISQKNFDILSVVEEMVHRIITGAGMECHVATSDATCHEDTSDCYTSIMFECDGAKWDVLSALETGAASYPLTFLTLTHCGHVDAEIREDAVESYVKEAIDNACLSEEEEAEALEPTILYRLRCWFDEDIREMIRDRLARAIANCSH